MWAAWSSLQLICTEMKLCAHTWLMTIDPIQTKAIANYQHKIPSNVSIFAHTGCHLYADTYTTVERLAKDDTKNELDVFGTCIPKDETIISRLSHTAIPPLPVLGLQSNQKHPRLHLRYGTRRGDFWSEIFSEFAQKC